MLSEPDRPNKGPGINNDIASRWHENGEVAAEFGL